jgi:Protein of unknown function (DUF3768)
MLEWWAKPKAPGSFSTLSTQTGLLAAVRSFNNFTSDNDPHGEHDFSSVELEGVIYFFKIDYYARDMQGGSEDPADPQQTTRVLTVMRALRVNKRSATQSALCQVHPKLCD